MAVIEKIRRGKRVLVIDIRYRKADGTPDRFRRDSKAPTKTAAREEEKRILERIARTGSPFEPKAEPEIVEEAPSVLTFADVVEKYTAKTGPREVPLAPPLARLLAPVAEGKREGYLSVTKDGEPWGQYGIDRAFARLRNRAGLSGWSVYSLRHFAITSWLRHGIPVHVVQKMAGHKHLSTTQRYVHFLKG